MQSISQNTISTTIANAGIIAGSNVENGRLHRLMTSEGRMFGKRPATPAKRGDAWPTEPGHPVVGSNVRPDRGIARSACSAASVGSDGYRWYVSSVQPVSVLPGTKLRQLTASLAAPLVLSQRTPRG